MACTLAPVHVQSVGWYPFHPFWAFTLGWSMNWLGLCPSSCVNHLHLSASNAGGLAVSNDLARAPTLGWHALVCPA